MRKLIIYFFIISTIIFSEDVKVPRYLYIAEIYQYKGSVKSSYHRVGIIKITKEGNMIYKSIIKNDPSARYPITEEGKLTLEKFNDLVNIDFSRCKLEYLEVLNNKSLFPLALKEIKGYDDESYRVLAIISKEAYEHNYTPILIEDYVRITLKERDYLCPEYYNGED